MVLVILHQAPFETQKLLHGDIFRKADEGSDPDILRKLGKLVDRERPVVFVQRVAVEPVFGNGGPEALRYGKDSFFQRAVAVGKIGIFRGGDISQLQGVACEVCTAAADGADGYLRAEEVCVCIHQNGQIGCFGPETAVLRAPVKGLGRRDAEPQDPQQQGEGEYDGCDDLKGAALSDPSPDILKVVAFLCFRWLLGWGIFFGKGFQKQKFIKFLFHQKPLLVGGGTVLVMLYGGLKIHIPVPPCNV